MNLGPRHHLSPWTAAAASERVAPPQFRVVNNIVLGMEDDDKMTRIGRGETTQTNDDICVGETEIYGNIIYRSTTCLL